MPTELDIQFEITQDNSGLVTMTPLGEGAISFDIVFGDDTPDPVSIEIGDNVSHTYSEGTYTVSMIGYGVTGLTSEITKELVVSFQAPTNLEVTIENDAAVSKQVNVTVNADFAVNYEVFSGETGVVDPVVANIGDTAVLQYSDAGFYDITIVVMGGAIETTTYVEENFEVTSIEAPIVSAPTPPSREPGDVISIFSSAYEDVEGTDYFPDWGQGGQGSSWAMFNLGGDEILQYVNLSYQGINLAEGTTVDVTAMEYLHLDVWTTDAVTDIETSIINNAGGVVTEAPVTESLNAGDWTSNTVIRVVATANNPERLDPAYVRRGRFDERFFIDLPGVKAREEIFLHHLQKRFPKSDFSQFGLENFARESHPVTGAEIEALIVEAKNHGFPRSWLSQIRIFCCFLLEFLFCQFFLSAFPGPTFGKISAPLRGPR